ncbi:hypothetical protein AX14_004758 [Amanita brunnescens Koide BX004]|nr:hypothetical protein AX14_004758 [Amanita brunnescens Koide BX004]
MLFTNGEEAMNRVKNDLQEMFEVTDLGEPSEIVSIEINIDPKTRDIKLTQMKYIEELLRKYGLVDANGVAIPMDPNIKFESPDGTGDHSNSYASLISSLMFIAVATRPDIAYAVNRLAMYTANPDLHHWTATKHILRYLSGTHSQGITYLAENNAKRKLTRYSDVSLASLNNMTSVSGYVFLAAGGAITWRSKKQTAVLLSSTEAKYMCLADATREATWLRNLYNELGFPIEGPTTVYGNNQSALAIANNLQYHKCTKHFDIKSHFIREKVNNQSIITEYCPTAKMTAEILTKPLLKPKFNQHKAKLGVS